jgi:hypothetical protein
MRDTHNEVVKTNKKFTVLGVAGFTITILMILFVLFTISQ